MPIPSTRSRKSVPIDPVAVSQQVARRRVIRKSLDHLLAHPESGGVRRDIEMNDTPTLVRHDHEYIQDTETNRWDGEEIQ